MIIEETSSMGETEARATRNSNFQYHESVPHIIDTGTSGIWTYRKWSDGTVECWGSQSLANQNISTAGRGSYYLINTINLPSGLFLNGANMVANINAGLNPGFAYCGITSISNISIGVCYVTQEAIANVSIITHIQIKGRWKL